MKKFIISLIILAVFASFALLWGWLEFFVPVDKYGVLISKTSGIKNEVISKGNFTWAWERLIPTNSKLYVFSATPKTYTKEILGSLPSANIYSNMLEGAPDFSYSFSVEVVLNILPETLPRFVDSKGGTDQEILDEYLNTQAESIARSTIEFILERSLTDTDFVVEASYSNSQLIEGIDVRTNYSDLEIASLTVNNIKLPDTSMYNLAKNTYTVYQESIQQNLIEAAESQSTLATETYLELERLSQLGRVLAEYPQLIEYEAVTNGSLPNSVAERLNQ